MQKATRREGKSPAGEPKAVYGGRRSVASGGELCTRASPERTAGSGLRLLENAVCRARIDQRFGTAGEGFLGGGASVGREGVSG